MTLTKCSNFLSTFSQTLSRREVLVFLQQREEVLRLRGGSGVAVPQHGLVQQLFQRCDRKVLGPPVQVEVRFPGEFLLANFPQQGEEFAPVVDLEAKGQGCGEISFRSEFLDVVLLLLAEEVFGHLSQSSLD